MSLSLLSVNSCAFHNCGLHFANQYDLIAHIEYEHLPKIEEQHQSRSRDGEDARLGSSVLPISYFQRLFPIPYRPTPVAYEPIQISFNHYRKRPMPSVPTNTTNIVAQGTDESRTEPMTVGDMEECGPNDTENRFRCAIPDCGKRYKNSSALRFHMSSTHGVVMKDEIPGAPEGLSASALAGSVSTQAPAPVAPSPTKYAASRPHKCSQCSKRYKTTQGLQNHVSQAHQKPAGNGEPGNPSPSVINQLITQARAHGQQQQQQAALEQQRAAAAAAANQQQRAASVTSGSGGTSSSPVSTAATTAPPPPTSVQHQQTQHQQYQYQPSVQHQQPVSQYSQAPLPVRTMTPQQQTSRVVLAQQQPVPQQHIQMPSNHHQQHSQMQYSGNGFPTNQMLQQQLRRPTADHHQQQRPAMPQQSHHQQQPPQRIHNSMQQVYNGGQRSQDGSEQYVVLDAQQQQQQQQQYITEYAQDGTHTVAVSRN